MRLLSLSDVVPYLLEHGFLDKKLIVEGDVWVEEVSRRNRNFRVVSRRGPCLFLKQARSQDAAVTLAREASVCRTFAESGALASLQHHLPKFYAYLPDDNLLILGAAARARSLREYQVRRGEVPVDIASALGQTLAAVHSLTVPASSHEDALIEAPWILAISHPDVGALRDFSMGSLRMLAIVQKFSDFGAAFDDLRRDWRNTALIHRDIKWDNVLIVRRGRRSTPVIVDWELAGFGDPCWDVGSELSSYLDAWLSSIPVTRDTPPERLVDLARYPLTRAHPSIAAFCEGWALSMNLTPELRSSWKLRAVRYGAARLVQTTYERLQGASHPTGNDVCTLQLSLNMLRRPEEAAVRLLGIRL